MKENREKMRATVLAGLLAACVLVLWTVPAAAEIDPADLPAVCTSDLAGDFDGDGYTNEEECFGITAFYNVPTSSFPGFNQSDTLASRNDYLDPLTWDLFVILRPATDFGATYSLLPADALEFVDQDQALGGLGIATHQVTQAEVDVTRLVTMNQAAVRITESLDTPFVGCAYDGEVVLGDAEYGTPNGLDQAEIFTRRIVDFIDSVCAGESLCQDVGGVITGGTACGDPLESTDALDDLYIKQSIAHEIGHMVQLVRPEDYNKRFGGYHYKSGSEIIMEQSIKYTSRKGDVTFYISKEYSAPSQGAVNFN